MGGRVAAVAIMVAFVGYALFGVVDPRRVAMLSLRYHRDVEPSPAGLVMTRMVCAVLAVVGTVMAVRLFL